MDRPTSGFEHCGDGGELVGRPHVERINLEETKRLLAEINATILEYDPVLREKARDILLSKAFGILPRVAGSGIEQTSLASSALGNIRHEAGLTRLIAHWSPETIADLALLSAYHLQVLRGYRGMSGKQIQNNLKHHGLHLSNVSVAAARNMETEPPRMKKRKARGTRGNVYVVTSAGAQYVEDKLDAADKNLAEQR